MTDIERPLNVFVTGASKGIGKASALAFAKTALGRVGDKTPEMRDYSVANVAVGCRSTNEMALNKNSQLVKVMQGAGSEAIAVYGDLTVESQLAEVVGQVGDWARPLGGIDVLVLNAAGGLEEGVPDDYGNQLNNHAQVSLVEQATIHLAPSPTIVVVESSWSELYPELPGPPLGDYRTKISATKNAGRNRVMDMVGEYHSQMGARALVLAAGIVRGTAVDRMARYAPEWYAEQEGMGNVVEINDVATRLVGMTHLGFSHGHVEWVGASPNELFAKYGREGAQ